MLRRCLATVVTLASAAALVLLPGAGASHAAEGECTLTPPARIAIYSDRATIPADISGDCRPNGFGYWFTPGDFFKLDFADAVFDASLNEPAVLHVPDVLSRYGLTQWGAEGAGSTVECGEPDDATRRSTATEAPASGLRTNAECNDLTQNEPYSDIRLGTYAAIAGTRNSASRVTFTVTSAIWSTGSDRLSNRSMKGELQTQYADGTWHRVGNPITTGANGKATFAVGLGVRTWRFGVYSTPYSFDRVSTSITR